VQYSTVQHNTTRKYSTVQYRIVSYSTVQQVRSSQSDIHGQIGSKQREKIATQILNDSARNYASLAQNISTYIFIHI
jgi:hypothetical protein